MGLRAQRVPLMIVYHENVNHYSDDIMGATASQITSLKIVYSSVYSGSDQRKHQSSASLAVVGNSPGTGEFPAQMASNAENVSIWRRHHRRSLLSMPILRRGYYLFIKRMVYQRKYITRLEFIMAPWERYTLCANGWISCMKITWRGWHGGKPIPGIIHELLFHSHKELWL